jgi:hypothetical protein
MPVAGFTLPARAGDQLPGLQLLKDCVQAATAQFGS